MNSKKRLILLTSLLALSSLVGCAPRIVEVNFVVSEYVMKNTIQSGTRVTFITLSPYVSLDVDASDEFSGTFYTGTKDVISEWRFYGKGKPLLVIDPLKGYEIVKASGLFGITKYDSKPQTYDFDIHKQGYAYYKSETDFHVRELNIVLSKVD